MGKQRRPEASPLLASAPAASEIIPTKTKVAYGLGSWPQGLTDSVVGFYWTAFLLEVCELTATKTASITLIGRVFDAVTDPLVGYWLTRTDTRWGKLRPWMSLAILPCAAFYIGMWLKPAGMEGDDPALFAYIVGVYLLYQFSTTCYYVPYTALVVHLSNDPGQRNLATSSRILSQTLGVVVSSGITGFFVNQLKDGDSSVAGSCRNCSAPDDPDDHEADELGHLVPALVLAVLIVGTGVACVLCTRERPGSELKAVAGATDSDEGESFMSGVKAVFGCPGFKSLLALQACLWMANSVNGTNLKLYFKYVYCQENAFDTAIVLLVAALMLSIPLWHKYASWVGKRLALTTSCGLFVPLVIIMGFVPADTPVGLAQAMAVYSGASLGAIYLIPWMMLTDTIDAHELRTGKRNEPIFYSCFVFFQKLAAGVMISSSTAALGAAGYDPDPCCDGPEPQKDCQAQPDSVVLALRLMFAVTAPVLMALGVLFVWLYPISEEKHREIVGKLDAARKKRAAGDASPLPPTGGTVSGTGAADANPAKPAAGKTLEG